MWNTAKAAGMLLTLSALFVVIAAVPAMAQEYLPSIAIVDSASVTPPATDAELLAAINALSSPAADTSAAATTAGATATATGDEVLGVSVTAQQLAFTGNEVSLPLAVGAAMIGGGSLMLLIARKHRDDE